MAEITIELVDKIHAEIIAPSTMLESTSIIIDPLTNSYSDFGNLIHYKLRILTYSGIDNPVILNNGKNSRFSASGNGTCTIELYVEDEEGNFDTDTINITVQ